MALNKATGYNMKRIISLSLLAAGIGLPAGAPVVAQTSGVIWIKTFSPGGSDLSVPAIDQKALTALDSLMQDTTLTVTFLGAADDLRWKMSGRQVHNDISEAWNDAKRLGRARILRARYGRGEVGVTDENVAGVKVVWVRKDESLKITAKGTNGANGTNGHDGKLREDMNQLRDKMDSMQAALDNGIYKKLIEKKGVNLNWRFQAGLWSWYGGSDRNIFTPALGLNVIYNRNVLVLQGGVAPWHTTTDLGKQGEAFFYAGIRHLPSNAKRGIGYGVGVFRGWEFYTATDSWSLKSTGLTAGPSFRFSAVELHPALTYAYIDSIFKGRGWRLGSVLTMNVNLN